jgi:dolichol kinase
MIALIYVFAFLVAALAGRFRAISRSQRETLGDQLVVRLLAAGFVIAVIVAAATWGTALPGALLAVAAGLIVGVWLAVRSFRRLDDEDARELLDPERKASK